MYVYGECVFYVHCTDCVRDCGNVLRYVVCLCRGCDGCCVF